MKRITNAVIAVALTLGLISCTTNPSTQDSLQGDWILPWPWKKPYGYYHAFSFVGDSLKISPEQFHSSYKLIADTLRVYDWYGPSDFRILRHTQDSLILKYLGNDPRFFYRTGGDTLRLNNLKMTYDPEISLEKIAYSGGWCYGHCPDIDIEISRDGSYYFQGHRYVDKIGSFISTDADSLFKRLEFLVQTAKLEEVQNPGRGFEDSYRVALIIWHNGEKKIFNGSYGDMGGLDLIVDALFDSIYFLETMPTDSSREVESRAYLYVDDEMP